MISLVAFAVLSPKRDTKITIRAEAQTIQAVVQSISEQTGEKLETAVPIRDDRVVLYADQVPAQEVLSMLAKHFGWSWEQDGDALKLTRTPKEELEEEIAYRREVLDSYKAWRSKSISALKGPFPASPQSGLANAIEDAQKLSDRYYGEYYSSDLSVRAKWIQEFSANEATKALLVRHLSPVWRLYDALVAGLSDDDLAELEKTSKLVFSYYPTSWQRPLPSGPKSVVDELIDRASKASHLDSVTGPATIDGQREMLLSALKPFEPSDVGTVRVTIKRELMVFPGSGYLNPTATLSVLNKEGQKIVDSHLDARRLPGQPAAPKRASHEPDSLDRLLEQNDDLKSADATSLSLRSVLKNAADDLDDFYKKGSKTVPAMAPAKLLIEVAKEAHVNFISDVYDTFAWSRMPSVPLGTARDTVDAAATSLDAKWTYSSNWIAMRAKNWEYARAVTMPAKDLFDLRDRLISTAGSFDTLADASLKISDREVYAPLLSLLLQKYANWNSYDDDQRSLYLLRFWATLPLETKRNLLGGQTVTYGGLGSAQQQYLASFVYRQDDESYSTELPVYEKDPGLEKPDVDWVSQAWPNFKDGDNFYADHEPTQLLPGGIPPDTQVGVHLSSANALILANGSGWSRAMTEQQAMTSGYYVPGNTEFVVRPALEDRVFFTLLFDPSRAFGFEMSMIKPADDSRVTKFSELPESIRQRLDSAYKARHGG